MSRSAERIVSLLWLLLEAGTIGRTKREIFTYLYDPQNTSATAKQRQFSRDKESLTSIGVPIQWHQSQTAEDVYVVDRDRLYLPDLALTDDEVLALHQARALWLKTPIEDAIHAALARMTADQPTTQPVVGAQLTEQPLMTDIVAAAREQAPIRFRYRTAAHGHVATRRVRPWAVLMAYQQWYVVGWDFDRHDERLFRLSRIESNTITVLPTDAVNDESGASFRPHHFNVEDVRARLQIDQSAAEGYVWIAENVASSLRIRAKIVEQLPGWELLYFTYREPLKTAASIAALSTNARVDTNHSTELAELVDDIIAKVRDAHTGTSKLSVPNMTKVVRPRRRAGDKDVIARRLGIVAVVNQHNGALSRAQLRQRFDISEKTLSEDLSAMQFWGMPETDFAGGQFELDPLADPVEISNAELLAQPWQLSAPEAIGLISGLNAVPTIPGISPAQQTAARTLADKLRDAINLVAPQIGSHDPIVHPDLSLGEDDKVAEVLHHAAQSDRVVTMSYYSESSGGISTRDIEPEQLLYASGHGYVRAWCRKSQDERTFRLDRIGTATMTDEIFDPTKHPATTSRIAPTVDHQALSVIIHATHRYRDIIGAYHPTATAIASDGSIFAELAFQTMTPLLDLLATHAGQLVVVEPQHIRQTVWQMTDRVIADHHKSAQ